MTNKEQNEALQSHLEILPKEQRALWKELKPLQGMGFVLYGGTAIALRLGHRVSIDFDFFSHVFKKEFCCKTNPKRSLAWSSRPAREEI